MNVSSMGLRGITVAAISLGIAATVSASVQVAVEPVERLPTPQTPEPPKAPDDQTALPKSRIGAENVLQTEEPAVQSGPVRVGQFSNPRYKSTFQVRHDSCVGGPTRYDSKRTIFDHRPRSQGPGFYLPVHTLWPFFRGPVILNFPPPTNPTGAMTYGGPVNVDVPMTSGVMNGKFFGFYTEPDFRFRESKFHVNFELTGGCSIKGTIDGEQIGW